MLRVLQKTGVVHGLCLAMLIVAVTPMSVALAETLKAEVAAMPVDVDRIEFLETAVADEEGAFTQMLDVSLVGAAELQQVLTKHFGATAYRVVERDETKHGQFGVVRPATLQVVSRAAGVDATLVNVLERSGDCPVNSSFSVQGTTVFTHNDVSLTALMVMWTKVAHESVGGLSGATTVKVARLDDIQPQLPENPSSTHDPEAAAPASVERRSAEVVLDLLVSR